VEIKKIQGAHQNHTDYKVQGEGEKESKKSTSTPSKESFHRYVSILHHETLQRELAAQAIVA
jgi:hypothetical protein